MRLYHVTFATKFRQPFLDGEIREFVLQSFREVAREIRVDVLAMEASLDHAHLLLRLTDDQKLAIVMQRLKGRSARDVFLKFNDLRDKGSSAPFWQEGYGSRHIFPEEAETVRIYIQNQQAHHGPF